MLLLIKKTLKNWKNWILIQKNGLFKVLNFVLIKSFFISTELNTHNHLEFELHKISNIEYT